jgi:uroporphyrin-III C-methyltransferase
VAPAGVEVHYSLQKRIDDGEVKWQQKDFEDADLFTLGREEVGNVVDGVFVTSGPHDPQSRFFLRRC